MSNMKALLPHCSNWTEVPSTPAVSAHSTELEDQEVRGGEDQAGPNGQSPGSSEERRTQARWSAAAMEQDATWGSARDWPLVHDDPERNFEPQRAEEPHTPPATPRQQGLDHGVLVVPLAPARCTAAAMEHGPTGGSAYDGPPVQFDDPERNFDPQRVDDPHPPPATPRQQGPDCGDFALPPVLARASQKTPLFHALQQRSITLVEEALRSDPDAAFMPLFDRDCELPLQCAVRLRCSVDIIQLLLQHGADVNSLGRSGRNAAQELAEVVKVRRRMAAYGLPDDMEAARIIELMDILREAGAHS